MKYSTGLRNNVLVTSSYKGQLDGKVLKIYGGTVPSNADAALPGGATLLCTISVDGTGTGVTMNPVAADGLMVKAAAETWQGTNVASGTATFFRMETAADTGALSTTAVRMQGTVGVAGHDLNLSSTALVASAIQLIDNFAFALPAE